MSPACRQVQEELELQLPVEKQREERRDKRDRTPDVTTDNGGKGLLEVFGVVDVVSYDGTTRRCCCVVVVRRCSAADVSCVRLCTVDVVVVVVTVNKHQP